MTETYKDSYSYFWLCVLHVLIIGSLSSPVFSQEDRMVVERIKVINQNLPVFNVFVDEDNVKWVANSKTVYKVLAKDVAEPADLAPGQQSLLQLPGGNSDIRWSRDEMKAILGDAKVTAAAYEKQGNVLWIGTDGYGVFKLSVNGGLKLLEEIYVDNSKLRSDFINSIYLAPDGKLWIATEDGALVRKKGGWDHVQRYFNIERIAGDRRQTWAIGDDLVWIIDQNDNWEPIEINKREIEGFMHDIALDGEGNLWIASNIITRYHIGSGRYEHFGPGQYFTSQFVNYVSVDDDGTIWVGTDDKGVYIIIKESTITVTTNLDQPVSCDGDAANGAASARIVGGFPPYSIAWSGGQSGDRAEGLSPGMYTVTVTDSKGSSNTAQLEVFDPRITISIRQDQEESDENAADAVVSIEVDGGVPGYQASWSHGASGAKITGLTSGNYSVTVTDQAGCTAEADIQVTRTVRPLSIAIDVQTPVRCEESADGIIAARAEGGVKPYTFRWSTGTDSSDVVKELGPGQYAVTVTDKSGMSASASTTIEPPSGIKLSYAMEKAASTNSADGVVTASASGGNPPYTYSWPGGVSGAQATGLAAGEYVVTVTDANGCSTTAAIAMTENILPLEVAITEEVPVACPGTTSATLRAVPTGGKSPYTFNWSTGQEQDELLEGAGAGKISVTVTDVTGTSAAAEFTLEQPEEISILLSALSPASTGAADGSARAEAAGGTPPYTYLWDNESAQPEVSDLPAGKHIITVTDANGCTATGTLTITEDILPLAVTLGIRDNLLCTGDSDASVTVETSGGKGPFQFSWSTGSTADSGIENLASGEYSVTVTDVLGTTASTSIVIDQPTALNVTATPVQPASTGNADGAAKAEASGGTEPYAYSWSTGSNSQEANALPPGEHTVTVTDINGCTTTASVEISEDILPLSVSLGLRDPVTCNGGSDGAVAADVSGGKGPFEYSWSAGSSSSESAEELAAGNIAVTVTDVAGNVASAALFIDEPELLNVQAIAVAPANTGSSDGQGKVQASGGTEPYAFLWADGSTAGEVNNLAPGLHTVTVTDANGCTAEATLNIGEDIQPLRIVINQTAAILCAGGSDAALEVDIEGGKPPFEYRWNTGDSGSPAISGVGEGIVEVSVTDAAGNSTSATWELRGPLELTATASVVAPASTGESDGIALAENSGGTEPFTYQWDTGTTGAEAGNLSPGIHTVTVTDANGCTASAQVEIVENILPLSVSLRQMAEIKCHGQASASVSVEIRGGKGPFNYRWNEASMNVENLDGTQTGISVSSVEAGSYVITVTDATGLQATNTITIGQPDPLQTVMAVNAPASTGSADGNAQVSTTGGIAPYAIEWDNGETAANAAALAPGMHSVTVTDANGCTMTGEIEISENILPLKLSVTASAQEVSCHGDKTVEIEITPTGGKRPYTFAWSDGVTSEAGDVARTGLGAGVYDVTVTDALGTTSVATTTISEPTPLELEALVVASATTDQADGEAQARASGGTPPYSYVWDNDETTANATGLGPGQRTVTVTDAKGCTATGAVSITEDILELGVSLSVESQISCAGSGDGSVRALVTGGKKPFTFKWSDNSSAQELAGARPGSYSVTVTDGVGQTAESSIELAEPNPITLEVVNIRAAAAEHVPDGKASVKIAGGTGGGYSIKWDNGDNTENTQNLSIGNHSVTVTDGNGCSETATFEITKKILPDLTAETLRSGSAIRIEQIQFDADSTRIRDESFPALRELYEFLYDNPTLVVEIGGHTNGLPPHDYCDSLSSARAKSVAEYIVGLGIEPKRVYYKGYGKRDPIATNQTPEGRRRNQRVEVKMLELREED